jgi:hypothetical protein
MGLRLTNPPPAESWVRTPRPIGPMQTQEKNQLPHHSSLKFKFQRVSIGRGKSVLTSCCERDMRADLARRGRSGGSSGPGPAVAAAGATFGEEEKGRRRRSDHWVLDQAWRGGAAQRSLGMAEAAAESMAVVCCRRCPKGQGGSDVTRNLEGLDLDQRRFDLVIHS